MPPAPPQPVPDTLEDTAHPVWQSADVFRAVLFGTLAVVYGILLFPLTVGLAALWLFGKLLDRGGSQTPTTTPAGG